MSVTWNVLDGLLEFQGSSEMLQRESQTKGNPGQLKGMFILLAVGAEKSEVLRKSQIIPHCRQDKLGWSVQVPGPGLQISSETETSFTAIIPDAFGKWV